MLAASNGTVEMLQVVLGQGANVNVTDNLGRTALHFACRRGSLEHAQVLLQIEDADLDAQTKGGVTALMMAVNSGNV